MAWPPAPLGLPELLSDYALAVQGLFVDRITHITKPLIVSETDLGKTIEEVEAMIGLDSNPFAMYKGNITLADAFWRTMFGDLLYSIDRSMKSELIVFDRAQEGDEQFFDIARYAWQDQLQNHFFISPKGDLLSEEQICHIANRARENFWYANRGNVFFKTESGYIGSCHAKTPVKLQPVVR